MLCGVVGLHKQHTTGDSPAQTNSDLGKYPFGFGEGWSLGSMQDA